jgi:hypothetical protein
MEKVIEQGLRLHPTKALPFMELGGRLTKELGAAPRPASAMPRGLPPGALGAKSVTSAVDGGRRALKGGASEPATG